MYKKTFLWLALLFAIINVSYSKKSSLENRIYFIRKSIDGSIDTSTTNRIYLSNAFWQYFFNRYPASSLILFLNTNSKTQKNTDNHFIPANTLDMKRLGNLLPNDASLAEKEVRFPMFSFFIN